MGMETKCQSFVAKTKVGQWGRKKLAPTQGQMLVSQGPEKMC